MSDYLKEIQSAILHSHRCESRHIATTPVKEVFQGKTIWEGEVETFELLNHAHARRAYAWGYPNDSDAKKLEVVIALEIAPVDSPKMAVKVAIGWDAKQRIQNRLPKL